MARPSASTAPSGWRRVSPGGLILLGREARMTRAAVSREPRSKIRKPAAGGRRLGANPQSPSAVPLASLPGAVVMTDQAGAITFVNAEAVRLTGWTAKAARGRLVGE